jgi:hypothetical protein
MPEQFRLNQIGGQGGTVHGDERRHHAGGILMNGTGRLLLAGTAFPGNQHRHIHFRRFLNAPKQGLHDGAVTDQPVLGFRLALLAQGGFGQIDHAVGVPKRHHQARGINGQGMIITAALGDDAGQQLAIKALARQRHDPLHLAAGQHQVDHPLDRPLRLATEKDNQAHLKRVLGEQRSGHNGFLGPIHFPVRRRDFLEQRLINRSRAQDQKLAHRISPTVDWMEHRVSPCRNRTLGII